MISKESFTGNNRGVSPVIGVILMVAVTVVLAAVIGASVLDIGNDVGESPSAAVEYDGDDTLTLISAQNVDSISVQVGQDGSGDFSSVEAGTSLTLNQSNLLSTGDATISAGDEIRVIGEVNGESQVLQTFEYEGEDITAP